MTDNEIIKALECCGGKVDCRTCHYKNRGDCLTDIKFDVLDLINRKDAEIEKLNVELVGMRGACESYKMHYDNAQAEIERLTEDIRILQYCNKVNISSSAELHDRLRTAKPEAIKEFWKKVRKHARIFSMFLSQAEENEFISYGDNLVKEMTEECEK